jgi:hypothetical protein
MAKQALKPGTPAPASGQYKTVGPRGGKGPEITGVKGKTLPPTQTPGSTYVIADRTKNNAGKGK